MYTDLYIQNLKRLHADSTRKQGFGGKVKKLGKFYDFIELWKPTSLLDYGCGKGTILEHLKLKYPSIKFEGYDPAVDMYSKLLCDRVECVFSNDVLEHIEPQFIDDVLEHIDNLAEKFIWLRIDTMPARKFLPDGRNAHILLKDNYWWHDKVKTFINGSVVYQHLDAKGKFDLAIEK